MRRMPCVVLSRDGVQETGRAILIARQMQRKSRADPRRKAIGDPHPNECPRCTTRIVS
jgi:hypothetical protein